MKKIGFVGLGIMGKPMARNLIKAGYSLTIHDRNSHKMDDLVSEGAEAVFSPKEVGEAVSVVITMVQDSAESEAAILGPDGVLEGASPGLTVIDMSSIAPGTSRRLAAACKSAGCDFLDAPVSGGDLRAVDGTLSIMVGGEEEVFGRSKHLLDVMGASAVLCGPHGAGNMTKLVNQIIVAANIEAVSEAFVLSRKAGLNPRLVFEAIRGGLAGSNVLNDKVPKMIARDFKPGFRIRLHHKDLNNALVTGKEFGVELPVTELVHQMLTGLIGMGKGDDDHSAISNFLEDMANITIGGD